MCVTAVALGLPLDLPPYTSLAVWLLAALSGIVNYALPFWLFLGEPISSAQAGGGLLVVTALCSWRGFIFGRPTLQFSSCR